MYKRYYSDKDNREFNSEEECRNHELASEAVEHLCGEPKPEEFFSAGYEEGLPSNFLSDEVKERLAKRYSLPIDFVFDFFGSIEFSFFVEHQEQLQKLLSLSTEIQNYINTAKKIDSFIDERG